MYSIIFEIDFWSKSPNTTEARTSPTTELVPHRFGIYFLSSSFKQTNRFSSGHGRHDVFVLGKNFIASMEARPCSIYGCLLSTLLISAYGKFEGNRRGYKVDNTLLEYGRGELPYNGSTCSVWNVDVNRLYVPLFVNQNHWISMCINLVNRTVDVFDCGGRKNTRSVEAFAVLISRIIKDVQSLDKKKDYNFICPDAWPKHEW
ncbi:hypothetical protein Bca4012_083276 [Brassica carinata]|uniref:Ubiquitin-like protease family profile domain-containing protein n=1 Tax=Brassica carinata TaxID=52824 RepID=A0A8X8AL78_BRACI|nr:hypothetical protein Bca52824_027497 [Brassica carinata]